MRTPLGRELDIIERVLPNTGSRRLAKKRPRLNLTPPSRSFWKCHWNSSMPFPLKPALGGGQLGRESLGASEPSLIPQSHLFPLTDSGYNLARNEVRDHSFTRSD